MSGGGGLALLLGCALVVVSASASAPLNRPTWTTGDTWTYRTVTALAPGLNLTGTVTSTVEGQTPTAVGGTTVNAYRVLTSGSGTARGTVSTASGNVSVQGSWVLTGEERFEPTNLELVYNLLDLSVNGTYQSLLPFSLRVQNTTTYQTVSDDWRYPLTPGSGGNQTVTYDFSQDVYTSSGDQHGQGAGEWTFSFSMGALSAVDTPAGSFPAYPITQLWPDGSRERSFASPQVGNDVRTESYAPDGNLTAVTALTSYRYQALETSAFLGLTPLGWAVIGVLGAAVTVLGVWRWQRRKKGHRPGGVSPPGVT